MQAIITATDFSDVATNAVHYACNMANDHKMPVLVLHSYTIPVAFHENPMPVISMEESKSIAESQMKQLVDSLFGQYPALSITGRVIYGDITENLKDTVADQGTWMIVVGNSSSDDAGFWLGSNLLSTLRSLPCPVLAVPPAYTYKKVEKIAFACDFNHINEKLPAADLVALIQKTGTQLHVLNVDQHNKHIDIATQHPLLSQSLNAANPQYHHIENEDIDQGLQLYVDGNNMDWLVVVPHRHNFFEGLFHKSQTKAIVRHAHIPILALHEKK